MSYTSVSTERSIVPALHPLYLMDYPARLIHNQNIGHLAISELLRHDRYYVLTMSVNRAPRPLAVDFGKSNVWARIFSHRHTIGRLSRQISLRRCRYCIQKLHVNGETMISSIASWEMHGLYSNINPESNELSPFWATIDASTSLQCHTNEGPQRINDFGLPSWKMNGSWGDNKP